MPDYLQSVFDWVTYNPGWAGVIIFLVAFGESMAVIGLIVPGVIIMFTIGALIAAGVIEFWFAMACAVSGAIAGDGLSFWIGAFFKHRIRSAWPFRQHPDSLQRGMDFFRRYGGKSILFGRFFGPVRAVVPLVAGMMHMPTGRFIFANVCSALLWAPVYLLPGMVFGASMELAAEVAIRLAVVLLGILVLLWFTLWASKRVYQYIQPRTLAATEYILHWLHRHPTLGPIGAAIFDPEHPEARGLAILASWLIVSAPIFVWATYTVFGSFIDNSWLTTAHLTLQHWRSPFADQLSFDVAQLGSPAAAGLIGCIVLLRLLTQADRHTTIHWVINAAFVAIVLQVTTLLPSVDPLLTPAGHREPIAQFSAYSFVATSLFGFLALLNAGALPTTRRWLPYSIASLLVTLVAGARLYLGATWLPGIIAGISLGLLWICLLGIAYRRHQTQPNERLILVSIFALGLIIIVNAQQDTSKKLTAYQSFERTPAISLARWLQTDWPGTPTSRDDLLEAPQQPMNLLWLGDQNHIESKLTNLGWTKSGQITISKLLAHLSPGNTIDELPVLPHVHAGEYESIRFTQPMPDPDRQRIVRLWPATINFSDSTTMLWIGTVTYQQRETLLSFLSYRQTENAFSEPLEDLVDQLNSDRVKTEWKYTRVLIQLP